MNNRSIRDAEHRLAHPCLTLLLAAAVIGFGAWARKAPAQEGPALVPAVSGISVQPSEQVFDTMCALDAAGFEAEENTLAEMPTRLALREQLLQLQGPATQAIRKFYREHVLASPTETLTPFMTFAVVSGPPPDFQLPDRDVLPPSVLIIDGFQSLLADFYRRV